MSAKGGRGGGESGGGPRRKKKINSHKGASRTYIDEEPTEPVEAEEEKSSSSSSEDTSDDEDMHHKPKGPQIETFNPNRSRPMEAPADTTTVNLNRKEREALEAQRTREAYLRMTAEGKTEQARRDLERLEQVRRERQEAARRREQELAEKAATKPGTKPKPSGRS